MSTPTVWKTKLAPEDVRPGDCKARRLDDIHRLPTTPYIHLESQCIQTPCKGSDLCSLCKGRWDAYAALPPSAETNLKKATRWRGRVTEPAMDWVHVMGTKWAEPVVRQWREKKALEERKAKDAAKKAAKAAKDAEAAAKKPAGGAGGPPPEEEVENEGPLKLIDGTLYVIKSGNVYEYDKLTEKAGDFVGRLSGESIDTEAEEVGLEEEVVVLEPPAAANAVKETANATPAVEHPSFEDLLGHLGMVEMVMDSTRSAAYKLIRLTEFLTVCSKADYAPFWRTDFDGRHRMRTNLIVWKEFGVCAAADTFLAMYPA